MSKRMIITISREYGSGGRIIATRLAEKLGIEFYDKDMISKAAKESGLDQTVIEKIDEKAPGLFITPYAPTPQDKLYLTQTRLINQIYDSGKSAVIVGRCANAILEGREDVMRIFIYAPLEYKVDFTVNNYHAPSADAAKKEILKADKIRRNYYQYFTEYQWGSREGYDLMIDSSLLGTDGTASLLADLAAHKFGA